MKLEHTDHPDSHEAQADNPVWLSNVINEIHMNKRTEQESIRKALRVQFVGYPSLKHALLEIRSWSSCALREILYRMGCVDSLKLKKEAKIGVLDALIRKNWNFISGENAIRALIKGRLLSVSGASGDKDTTELKPFSKLIIQQAEIILRLFYLIGFKESDIEAGEERLIEQKSYPRNTPQGDLSLYAKQAIAAIVLAREEGKSRGVHYYDRMAQLGEQIEYLEQEYINPIENTKL